MNRLIAPTLSVTAAVAVSLGCYLVSARVGAERARVAELRVEMARDAAETRALEAELMRRGAFGNLEAWNTRALAMEAPVPAQLLLHTADLAALAPGAPRLVQARAVAAPQPAPSLIETAARTGERAAPDMGRADQAPGSASHAAPSRLIAAELHAPAAIEAKIAARAPKADDGALADLTQAVHRELKAAEVSPLRRVSLR